MREDQYLNVLIPEWTNVQWTKSIKWWEHETMVGMWMQSNESIGVPICSRMNSLQSRFSIINIIIIVSMCFSRSASRVIRIVTVRMISLFHCNFLTVVFSHWHTIDIEYLNTSVRNSMLSFIIFTISRISLVILSYFISRHFRAASIISSVIYCQPLAPLAIYQLDTITGFIREFQ